MSNTRVVSTDWLRLITVFRPEELSVGVPEVAEI
jgi:hypothetical protein